jgi:hypothetical protein
MRLVRAILLSLLVIDVAQAQSTRQQLADFLPRDANVVVGVNVPRLVNSQAGQSERFDAFLQMQVGEGRTTVSPTGEGVVMAANVDLNTQRPTWQLFLWRNSTPLSADDLAQRIKGTVESISDHDAVAKKNFLLVKLMPDAWGVLSPANRQVTGRWLRDSTPGRAPMAIVEKLREAALGGSTLAVIIDVRDFFSAQQLSRAVSKSEMIIVDARMSGDEAAPILASVEWATIRINAGSTFEGEIVLDFERSVERLKPIAMKLLQTVMSNRGLVFDDLSKWTATATGTRLVARGPVTARGVRKLLTLLDPPRPSLNEGPADAIAGTGEIARTNTSAGSADSIAIRSAAYFKEVNKLVDDLQGLRNADADSGIAFIGKYIKKIEAISIVNIDPVLVDWSADVMVTLSESVKALRSAKIQGRKGALAATSTYDPLNVSVGFGDNDNGGDYGTWYDVYEDRDEDDARADEMRRMRTKAASERVRAKVSASYSGREAALQLLSNLDQQSAAVRRAMVAKYKIDF